MNVRSCLGHAWLRKHSSFCFEIFLFMQGQRDGDEATLELHCRRIRTAVLDLLGVTKIRLVAASYLQFTVPSEANHLLPAFLTYMKVCTLEHGHAGNLCPH